MKKALLFLISLFLSANFLIAATRTASTSGNWSSTATWGGSSTPVAGDIVVIPTGKNVTIDGNVACASVSISGTGSLVFGGTYTLTITGNYANSGAAVAGSGMGTLICNGATTISGTTTSIFYNIQINATKTLTASASNLQIEGSFTNNGTFTHNSGTVIVNGFMEIFGSSTTAFKNVIINAGATFRCKLNSNTQIEGDLTNNGTFAERGGTIIFNGTSTIYGTQITVFNSIIINSGKTLTAHATIQMQFKGNFQNDGTFTHNGGISTFVGTTTISGSSITSFNRVTIIATYTLTAYAGNMNVAGNWSNAGTFNHNNGTVTFNGTSTVSGAAATSFNNVTINATNTLTGHATNMNIAGNFINNGTYTHNSGTVTFNGTSTISGSSATSFNNISIASGNSLTGHATNMNVAGTFTDNGTFTPNNGTVTFNGTVAQNISGTPTSSAGTTFYGLTMNNSGTGLVLGHSINVNSNLTMTDGDINLNGSNIELGTTGLLVSEANDKRVYGTSGEIRATRSIPILSTLNVGGLGATIITTTTAITTITIERGHAQQTGWYQSPVARYFDITSTPSTLSNTTLIFDYLDNNELNGQTESDELNFILYRSTDGGTVWQPRLLSIPDPILNQVTIAATNPVARWSASNGVTSPLPIELINYTIATNNNKTVSVNWRTATEINNDYFTVERSADGISFNEIGKRSGSNSSGSPSDYEFIDNKPLTGTSYYRLKQTDLNGITKLYSILPVSIQGAKFMANNIYPNPSNRSFSFQYSIDEAQEVNISLFNLLGTKIETLKDGKTEVGQYEFEFGQNVKPGIYFLTVKKGSLVETHRIIKR